MAAVEVCSRCGQEVRWGWRHGREMYWHREDVDHQPVFGQRLAPPPPEDLEEERDLTIPPPEVSAHPVGPDDFPPRSGIRQIYNLIGKTPGWEVVRFTAARGPYVGSKGEVLSISDSVVLTARGPVLLDGSRRVAVASWRDGAFDFAHLGVAKNGRIEITPGNSAAMKDWIKHREPEPPQVP